MNSEIPKDPTPFAACVVIFILVFGTLVLCLFFPKIGLVFLQILLDVALDLWS